MKLYINNPSSESLTIAEHLNDIISKLNSLFDIAEQYKLCQEENQKLRTETLPIYKEQETRYAHLLSKLEHKENQITSELNQLSALHIVEKKRLQHDLASTKSDIAINYNNYSRARNSVNEIIQKISNNDKFMVAHPLNQTIESYQQILTTELNPSIERLSTLLKTPLVTYKPNSMLYIERYEIAGEDSFELE